MENIFLWFLLPVALLVLAKLIFRNREAGKKQYSYKQKDFFMSRPEHEFFDILLSVVGDKYHVFSQVHLPTIVDNRVYGQNWRAALSHVNRKSVDFVLCDKNYIKPVLAIELDDKTHEREDRKTRDEEVERILKSANLPILRFENHGSFKKEEISQRIFEILLRN